MNGTGDWKQLFTAPAAELIKNQLTAKASMKLATRYDASLGVCEACACPLPLKVWAPLEYALRKMSKETKEKLPEWCWMQDRRAKMSKYIPSTETSCICDCGCFLISLESDCPICGNANPVYGNKSIEERENEYADREDDWYDEP